MGLRGCALNSQRRHVNEVCFVDIQKTPASSHFCKPDSHICKAGKESGHGKKGRKVFLAGLLSKSAFLRIGARVGTGFALSNGMKTKTNKVTATTTRNTPAGWFIIQVDGHPMCEVQALTRADAVAKWGALA